ncbi:hypothetical protein [Nitrincola schmidtii]|uniref:hypothetical protein n=1 Tax=Nitrincola schmidtii TaxID=1730894 RepID=UPI00124C427D|nr:hypothetical protein [Nitrincola schmidtii]
MLRWLLFGLLGLGVFFVIAAEVVLDKQPAISDIGAPTPEDVYYTKSFVEQVRAVTEGRAEADEVIVISEADANALMRVGARMLPRGVGRVTLNDEMVWVEGAMQIPWPLGERWLNVAAAVLPYKDQLSVEHLILGGFRLPPNLTLDIGLYAFNFLSGRDLGSIILSAASEMVIQDDAMVFSLALSEDDRGNVLDGLFGVLRGGDMPEADLFVEYYISLREAMDAGQLPSTGSFVPYVRFALQHALDGDESLLLADRYTAAMLAVTWACGSVHTATAIGRFGSIPKEADRDWDVNCHQLTFHDRIDLRRHFITAAAIQAISNRGVSVSAGEFKELLDSIGSGAYSGFDFTDIVANNSGIRLSNLMMSTPAEHWPELIGRIQSEEDVIASLEGVPEIMPRAEFEQRFGDVDSDEYAQMIRFIESKIDLLPLHSG